MPSARMRISTDHRNSISGGQVFDHPAATFAHMLFGFLEEDSESLASSGEEYPRNEIMLEEEDEERVNGGSMEEDKTFWENQNQLLQATICRTSSLETNIRNIVKEAMKEIQMTGSLCGCGRLMADGCRNCLMREVSSRLRNAGYDSAICKTKWRTNPDIPAGEHTFLDVIDTSNKKKGETRIIIELNFRSEFELAKASEEYNRLVRRLPEIFVGKVERLSNVIKILCLAAKKCMKEKKMHLGPWRKSRYMQAKWLSPCERTRSMSTPLPTGDSRKQRRPKASMLTVDLSEMYPNMHCTAVEVVSCVS